MILLLFFLSLVTCGLLFFLFLFLCYNMLRVFFILSACCLRVGVDVVAGVAAVFDLNSTLIWILKFS